MSLKNNPVHIGAPVTASELGKVFANMDDHEQAQFWNGVAAGVIEWPEGRGYSYGEMQWCYLRDTLLKPENKEGLAVLQSLSAWVLLHAWNQHFGGL